MRCCVDLNPFVRCAGRHCTCALSSGCSIAKRVAEGASDAGGAGQWEADDDDGGGGGAAAAAGQPVGLI